MPFSLAPKIHIIIVILHRKYTINLFNIREKIFTHSDIQQMSPHKLKSLNIKGMEQLFKKYLKPI